MAQRAALVLAALAACLASCVSAQDEIHLLDNQIVPIFPACSASYATPCAFNNVYRLVESLVARIEVTSNTASILANVDAGEHNVNFGFTPYIFNATSMACLANGRDTNFNGLTLDKIAMASSTLVQQEEISDEIRQAVTSSQGSGWLKFTFVSEDDVFPDPIRHLMYVREATNDAGETFVVMASLAQRSLPRMDVDACPVNVNRRCSITNVRSLVGSALSHALSVRTPADLRALWTEMTYPEDTTFVDGSWYVFSSSMGGPSGTNIFVAHSNPDWIGLTTYELFEEYDFFNGTILEVAFSDAAQRGGGWARYDWFLSVPTQVKVSFVVGVELFGQQYYLGAGFMHTRDPATPSALCATCSANYSEPCAIGNALSLSAHAEVELLTVTETGFDELASDPYRMDLGFGVLVVDVENRTVMADSLDDTTWGEDVTAAFAAREIANADTSHAALVALANQGGGWIALPGDGMAADFAGYVTKVNKYERAYYLLSGYRRDRAPIVEDCSADYAHECSEVNAKALIGHLVSEIQLASSAQDLETLLTAINSPLDQTYAVGPDFNAIVLDENFAILALEDAAGRDDWETAVKGETFVTYVQQHEAVSSLGNDFETTLRAKAFEVGGEAFEVAWNDAYGSITSKVIFVQAAKRPTASGSESTYYVLTMFSNEPAPTLCSAGCPENAYCVDHGTGLPLRCECGFYYTVQYENSTEESACTNTFTNTLVMTCIEDEEKMSILSVKSIAQALGSLNLGVALLCITWTVAMRKTTIVRVSQPMLLVLVGAGTMVSSSTIFMMTIDDSVGRPAGSGANARANIACMAQPWFYGLGFALTYCSMIVKLRRVAKVFKSAASLKKVKGVSLRVTLMFLVGLLSVEVLLLMLWTVIDPLKFERPDEDPLNGSCKSPLASTFVGLLAAYHLSLLFYGANLSYQCRKVNGVFAETKYLSLAMIGNLQVLLLALPVIILTADDAGTSIFIRSIAVFLNDLSTTLLIFGPKMYFSMFGPPDSSGTGTSALHSKSNNKSNVATVKSINQTIPSVNGSVTTAVAPS
ncbi:Metabotropic glutamate receptor-like protein E [Hondaea fermentalgiana]|uniref:Metabotropic glutamate receptor-like protein E n=1 Tax=Hondaea fermentalgiana TaxID=2315210 RepID=A0A2R5GNS7_9STRA|nr:Metabotropic glutamate receptor-like protein E [Hondaea fermentalgiana]|eukprot:GBG32275.1 Metabotropic glutamate receptor-like protein E [Hondaea fermentalgiana]